MRRSIGVIGVSTALLASIVIAAPAQAATYQFKGDKGTSCTVQVGTNASHVIGALSGTPRVGFSATPTCHYATLSGTAGSGTAGAKAAAKACKKKKTKRAKARCKAKKRKARPRAAAAAVGPSALLDLAKLDLLAPLGVQIPGQETLASLGLGGYTCLLSLNANCSDSGQLEPAVPYASYLAQFSMRLTPPPGEHWVSAPPACSAAAVLTCLLSSEAVTPTLF